MNVLAQKVIIYILMFLTLIIAILGLLANFVLFFNNLLIWFAGNIVFGIILILSIKLFILYFKTKVFI
jgi:hypothetical protein